MKINFKMPKINWSKVNLYGPAAIHTAAILLGTAMCVNYASKRYSEIEEQKQYCIDAIKSNDVERYNRICDEIVTGKKLNNADLWLQEYNAMNDSVRVAQRAYFEGSQSALAGLKNVPNKAD